MGGMRKICVFNGVNAWMLVFCGFFFQAEDGIRDLVRSRGLGDVYKRQTMDPSYGGLLCRCG